MRKQKQSLDVNLVSEIGLENKGKEEQCNYYE